MLQKPKSLGVVEFPVPTVAVKLEDDSAVRIGLPAIEAAVRIDLGGASPHLVAAHGVVGLDANLLVSRSLRDRGRCEDRSQGQCGNQGLHDNAPL
jgi:hypothetical protein